MPEILDAEEAGVVITLDERDLVQPVRVVEQASDVGEMVEAKEHAAPLLPQGYGRGIVCATGSDEDLNVGYTPPLPTDEQILCELKEIKELLIHIIAKLFAN